MKTVILSMLFAPAMLADSVTLVSVNGASEDGFYVSPYELSIDGGQPIEVWCVDFLDHVDIGQTWNAIISDGVGLYDPTSSDYAKMFGIIQAEINDPNPNLVGYQNALWSFEDPTDFAAPTGVYLADESTPLTASFQVIDGENFFGSAGTRPQEFIVDAPPTPEPATWATLGIGIILMGCGTKFKRKGGMRGI